jgi:hypothetical protein
VVLNLTEELRVDLSVDRGRVKDLKQVAGWLGDQIRAGAYRHLLKLPNLHLLFLNAALVRKPLAIFYLDRMLRAADCSIVANVVFDKDGQCLPFRAAAPSAAHAPISPTSRSTASTSTIRSSARPTPAPSG